MTEYIQIGLVSHSIDMSILSWIVYSLAGEPLHARLAEINKIMLKGTTKCHVYVHICQVSNLGSKHPIAILQPKTCLLYFTKKCCWYHNELSRATYNNTLNKVCWSFEKDVCTDIWPCIVRYDSIVLFSTFKCTFLWVEKTYKQHDSHIACPIAKP